MFTIMKEMEQFGIAPPFQLFKRGTYLFKAGSIAKSAFFIKNGSVSVQCDMEKSTQIIRFGYAGSLITALDSYLNGKSSIYTIQALKASEVAIIPKSDLEAFWNYSNANRQLWLQIVESLIVQQMERELDLLTVEPALRYQRVMQRSPQLFQEVPHKYIANYLRMSPETLSRLKKP